MEWTYGDYGRTRIGVLGVFVVARVVDVRVHVTGAGAPAKPFLAHVTFFGDTITHRAPTRESAEEWANKQVADILSKAQLQRVHP